MAVYRKNADGKLVKVANNFVQRWNDKIFRTSHSIISVNGLDVDLYTIIDADKYIANITEFTEYQLYFETPNTTNSVYIKYKNAQLKLKQSSNALIGIGLIKDKINMYTLDNIVDIWLNDAIDLPNYYTKNQILELIDNIQLEADLSNFYNKPEIDEKLEKLEVNGGYL